MYFLFYIHHYHWTKLKKYLTSFGVSVYHAIQEFHCTGFAYLDIRVPNICFKKEKDWRAVLIDLDQVSETYKVDVLGCDIEDSIIFSQKFEMFEKYDWP